MHKREEPSGTYIESWVGTQGLDTREVKSHKSHFYKPNQFGGELTPRWIYLSSLTLLREIDIESKFNELVKKWKEETAVIESPTKKYLNENYLRIIKLGEKVIPFILKEMRLEPDDWFLALRVLTETNPVKPEESKNFKLATEAWIKWGTDNQLL